MLHHLGHLLALSGRRPEAIEKFREAASRDPLNYRHHFRLAQEYRSVQDRERMFELLTEAMRLNPDEAYVIGFKAMVLREFDSGNAEILALAQRWVEKTPKDSSARMCLSDELRKIGEIEQAIEHAEAAVQCNPDVAWNFHYLAHLYTLKSRWNIALQAIDQAIELEPERAMHHHVRGEISLEWQKLVEAARLAGNGHGMQRCAALAFPPTRSHPRLVGRSGHRHASTRKGDCPRTRQRTASEGLARIVAADDCRLRMAQPSCGGSRRRTRQVRQRKQYNRRADHQFKSRRNFS